MKKLLLSVLFLPVFAFAQQQQQPQEIITANKEVTCVDTATLMNALEKSEFKEIPYWMGTDSDSYWGLVVNEKTGTWTMIQFTQDLGCIIGSGKNHKLVQSIKSK